MTHALHTLEMVKSDNVNCFSVDV